MKLTKRKGFNFFRSYYDVYNELNNKDKVAFIDALLDRQFLGVKPENLNGMAKFAYISQTNSIDSQVKGFEDKTGIKLSNTPTKGARQGGNPPPTGQVEVEGEVQVEVEGEVQHGNEVITSKPLQVFLDAKIPDPNNSLFDLWQEFIKLKKRKKASTADAILLNQLRKLYKLGKGDHSRMVAILEKSVLSGWCDFYEPKTENGGQSRLEKFKSVADEANRLRKEQEKNHEDLGI